MTTKGTKMRHKNNAAKQLVGIFFGPIGIRRVIRPATFRKPYDPRINRHTGKPHQHKREITRHLRRRGLS